MSYNPIFLFCYVQIFPTSYFVRCFRACSAPWTMLLHVLKRLNLKIQDKRLREELAISSLLLSLLQLLQTSVKVTTANQYQPAVRNDERVCDNMCQLDGLLIPMHLPLLWLPAAKSYFIALLPPISRSPTGYLHGGERVH